MNSTISRIVLASFLLVASYGYANPRVVQITPLIGEPIVINSTPIRFSIVFSEPVFGFTKEDILTNGNLLALNGREAAYTALIVPTQNQLIIDILVDSVHNINHQGNEILTPPFVWNLDNSPPPPITAFIPRTAAPSFGRAPASYPQFQSYYVQPPVQSVPLIQPFAQIQPFSVAPIQPVPVQPLSLAPVQPLAPRPVQPAQPPVVQAAPPPESPPPEPIAAAALPVSASPVELEEPAKERNFQTKFIFNVGAYNDAPNFFNIEGQTGIDPGQTTEFTTGIELFHRPNIWRRGLGYFAALGYQQSSYSSTQPDSSASYTAVPLEFGLNIYLNSYLSTSVGGIMHFNGKYKHKGNIGEALMFGDEVTLEVANGADSFEAGIPGLILSLNYNYKVFSAALRFISLPLNDYENPNILKNPDFLRVTTNNNEVNIRTLNAIENIGLFFQIRV